jgi:hypothetical protein
MEMVEDTLSTARMTTDDEFERPIEAIMSPQKLYFKTSQGVLTNG